MPRGVGVDVCTFFGLHTILFDFGGVVVDFGASAFCFDTVFLGGLGTTFGFSSFCFRFFFFGSGLFLFSLFFLDEVVHQLRLYLNLLYALWVQPVLDFDHGALLLLGPKVELLFFAIDVEADFSSSNINLCSSCAEEGSPKDEGQFLHRFHI